MMFVASLIINVLQSNFLSVRIMTWVAYALSKTMVWLLKLMKHRLKCHLQLT